MYADMGGWVITRPGFRDEPKRVLTWYIAPHRKDAIEMATKFQTWKKLRGLGYRCEKARVVVSVTQ